jgi:hypothetical protein
MVSLESGEAIQFPWTNDPAFCNDDLGTPVGFDE